MIDSILIIGICILIVYLFTRYLVYADNYYSELETDISGEKKNSFIYSLLPPKAVSDSYYYFKFWVLYYYEKYSS